MGAVGANIVERALSSSVVDKDAVGELTAADAEAVVSDVETAVSDAGSIAVLATTKSS